MSTRIQKAETAGSNVVFMNRHLSTTRGAWTYVEECDVGKGFEVAYHLPYSGEATIMPKVTSDMQHFVVVLPKSMTFEAKDAAAFSPMNDPAGQSNVEVASGVTPGKDLAFRVSGTGILQEEGQGGGGAQLSGAGVERQTATADQRSTLAARSDYCGCGRGRGESLYLCLLPTIRAA